MNKTIKNLVRRAIGALAIGVAASSLPAFADNSASYYYSDDLLATNFVINASGTVNGTVTNLTSRNYADSLPDGWISTKGITPSDLNANGIALEAVTLQLPTGLTGNTYTNSGIVYTNGIVISSQVVPQTTAASNVLVLTLGLALDDVSKHFPPATNNAITVTFNTSASTNTATGYQSWVANIGSTNFLGARYTKVLSAWYYGSNALQVLRLRAGLWY